MNDPSRETLKTEGENSFIESSKTYPFEKLSTFNGHV